MNPENRPDENTSFRTPRGPDESDAQREKRRAAHEHRLPYQLGHLFDTAGSPVEAIMERLEGLLPLYDGDKDTLIAAVRTAASETDRAEFIERLSRALQPIIDLYAEKGEAFESVSRKSFIEQGGFTEVNQMVAYDIDGDEMHVHIPPNGMTGTGEKLQLLKAGLRGIATALAENSEVKQLRVESWIIAKHPRLLDRMGFTIEGAISDEEHRQGHGGEPRDVYRASISREEFLHRYGQNPR